MALPLSNMLFIMFSHRNWTPAMLDPSLFLVLATQAMVFWVDAGHTVTSCFVNLNSPSPLPSNAFLFCKGPSQMSLSPGSLWGSPSPKLKRISFESPSVEFSMYLFRCMQPTIAWSSLFLLMIPRLRFWAPESICSILLFSSSLLFNLSLSKDPAWFLAGRKFSRNMDVIEFPSNF